MGYTYKDPYNDGSLELTSLVAAGLIAGFRQSSPEDVYEKAAKCFNVLMDILEDPETAGKIAAIINKPAASIKDSVQSIMDLLLFNVKNDPYMSLCLPRYASGEQVSSRWKRLLVFYHPDKYSNRPEYVERAKRINGAYESIQKTGQSFNADDVMGATILRNADYASINNEIIGRMRKRSTSSLYKYLKRLPAIILLSSLIVCIISMLIFILANWGGRLH